MLKWMPFWMSCWGGPAAPEPEDGAGDSAVSDGVVSQPDGSSEPQPGGEMMM